MNLANLARRNNTEPGRIAYNAAMYIAVEPHDDKEMLVCRPHTRFLNDDEFMEIFRRQDKTTELYTNPSCLRYLQYSEDDRGPFWFMTPGKYISLAQLMVDKSTIRLNEKWVDGAIDELLNITGYLHKLHQYALELTPHSILVTKDANNHIILMPPLSDFLPLKSTLYPTSDERLAPELFNIEEPDQRADIYGIGRIIEYLHPYPTLPFKYKAVVKNAVFERVDVRPRSTWDMQETIASKKKSGHATNIALSVAAVLAFAAIILFVPFGEDKQRDIRNLSGPDTTLFNDGVLMGGSSTSSADPLVNTGINNAEDAESARMLDEYMHDSTYMSMDTAVSLSPEMKEHQRKMMILASQKFRSQFKQQIRPILRRVYTKENLESKEKFMGASQDANLQIIDMQMALTSQYQIDATTSNRIAAEVYDEVVEELKRIK